MTSDIDDTLRTLDSKATNLRIYQMQTETAIAYARLAGASWSQIGERLGVTKQAAQQRYARMVEERRPFLEAPADVWVPGQ